MARIYHTWHGYAPDTGPVIPLSGLNLYYDFGNPSCYPGSGATAFDLSGNSNDGAFQNLAAVSTDFGGVARLPIANSQILVPYHTTLQPTTGSTYIIFLNSPFTNINRGAMGVLSFSPNRGWSLGSNNADSTGVVVAPTGSTLISARVTLNIKNTWVMLSARFSPSNYLDIGVNASQVAINNTSIPASIHDNGRDLVIGDRGDGSAKITGDIGPVMIYSRAISNAELLQIFNAFKSRFGLP